MTGPEGEFLFVGADAVLSSYYGPKFGGSIKMSYPFVLNEPLAHHLRTMTPINSSDNPWFMQEWEEEYNCTFNEDHIPEIQCTEFEHLPLPDVDDAAWLSNVIDGFYAIAHGLHNLISTRCADSFQNASLADACVSGAELLKAIKNYTFQGTSWTVTFDDAGDIMSPYVYRQIYSNKSEDSQTIGTWDKLNVNISIDHSAINWADFGAGADVTRDADGVPDSVCSYPCGPRQYQQQRELVCCWDCMSCRNNEIINADRDGCEKCPELMWPDEETATYCVEIEPRLVYYVVWIAL